MEGSAKSLRVSCSECAAVPGRTARFGCCSEGLRGCSGQAFPASPALSPGKVPGIPSAGLPGPGSLLPCPALPSPRGGSAPPRAGRGRDAGPRSGRPELRAVSRAMANVKVALRVRPLSKRCGGAREGPVAAGAGGDRCRWCCQPGRDRRPGAAQPGLREGRQALGSSAVWQEERQPLAAPLNSLERLLRKVTQWSC